MRFNKGLLAVSGFAAFALSISQAAAANSPNGVWLNDSGRGAIEVKPCGDGVCGHVVWLRDATDVKGCGRQIIGEAKPVSSGMWDNGWIYSPEKKKKYDVELKPLDDGNLRVKGYAGTKLFSKTMIWTPAPADLKRCGTQEVAKVETKPGAAPAPAPVAATGGTPPVATPAPAAVVKDAPKPAPVAATPPADTAPAPVPATPPVAEKNPDAKSDPVDAAPEPKVADDSEAGGAEKESIDIAGIIDKLKDFEKETGYGLKKTSDGECRLKVPFATIKIKCENID